MRVRISAPRERYSRLKITLLDCVSDLSQELSFLSFVPLPSGKKKSYKKRCFFPQGVGGQLKKYIYNEQVQLISCVVVSN